MKICPFSDSDTLNTFRNLIDNVTKEIQSLDNEYILKASQTELDDHFVNKVIIQPLFLHVDQYYIENQVGTQIDISKDFRRTVYPDDRRTVPGTRIDIAIPFEGDPILWRVRPSKFSLSGYPEIDVRDDTIILSIIFTDASADPKKIKPEIERQIQSIANAVQYLQKDVENHNMSAPQAVRSAIQRKRQILSLQSVPL